MPVDTSMYPTKPAVDPMTGAASGVNLLNSLQQNRMLNTQNNMLSQGYAADQAIGAAAQGAINPDGSYNPGVANRAIAANPAASYHAPAAIAANTNLTTANLGNQGTNTAQAQSRMNDFYTTLGPLLAGGSAPTRAQVMSAATDMLHQGRLLPQDVIAINGELPLNPAQIGTYAQNKFASTLSSAQQANPTTTGVDPNTGQPVTGTAGQAFKRATTPPTAAAPAPAPGYATTLPLGTPEVIKANNDVYLADQASSSAKMAGVRNLQSALPLIQSLNSSDFGPGSDAFSKVKQGLITAGILSPDSTASTATAVRQEANKYLLKYAGSAASAGRSDEGLGQALHSNPNLDLTQGANLNLIKNQIGMDRMDAATPIAFAQQPGQKNAPNQNGYLGFKASFNQSNDPRAFSFDLMTQPEREAVVKTLGPQNSAPYQKFLHSLQLAHDAGLTTLSSGQPEGSQ